MIEIEREGLRVTIRLVQDLRMAHASWAQFAALDHSYNNTTNGFRLALDELKLKDQLSAQADACIRDAIMAMFRMTDNSGANNDCLTLCRLSELLGSVNNDYKHTQDNINLIRAFIPPKWSNEPPAQDEIFKFH